MGHVTIDPRDEDLRLLRIEQVLELVPMARSSIYRNVEAGEFPAPIKMGNCTFWVSDEIRAWVRERCQTRRDNCDVI